MAAFINAGWKQNDCHQQPVMVDEKWIGENINSLYIRDRFPKTAMICIKSLLT